MDQFFSNVYNVFVIMAAIDLFALIATINSWVRYRGRTKPIWPIVLTIITILLVLANLWYFSFWWQLSQNGPYDAMDLLRFLSNLFLFGSPMIAISTLVATVLGWVKHRGRSKPIWIIACAVISAIMLPIALWTSYYLCCGARSE